MGMKDEGDWTPTIDATGGDEQRTTEVNDADFDHYYIDTACQPTFTQRAFPASAVGVGHKRGQLPNGHSIPVAVMQRARMQFSNGKRLELGKLASAPDFERNLLSVPMSTRQIGCKFVFTPTGGAIVSGAEHYDAKDVVTPIKIANGLYAVRGLIEPEICAASTAMSRRNQQATIDEYFHKQKLVRRPKPTVQVNLPPQLRFRVVQRNLAPNRQRQPGQRERRRRSSAGEFPSRLPAPTPFNKAHEDAAHEWHLPMNHTSPETVRIMEGLQEVSGIDLRLQFERPPISCYGCAVGHTKRAPHKSTHRRLLLDIHSQLMGPVRYLPLRKASATSLS